MSCRFPGASTLETFWKNLRQGAESLTELSDEELLRAGVPAEQFRDPAYVRRMPVIEGVEELDAAFFGYTPQEATIMDPQHRLFLECAWEVLEQGGYDPGRFESPIGVFTGAKTSTYLFNVVAQRHRFPALDNFQIALGNDLAAMATRVSYKLDLRGPSYALHTACSTSLVAVHLACQSLMLDECSMAIAGGAAINVPQEKGYSYQKGGILSPDGSCRTFDADAAGSNFGNGVGAVLLKRLEDALADRDHVHAVIRGSATNNDGARKASFTAPGVEGQTAVLLEAMAVAGVEAEDISYLEAHGTATALGDSIEMLALSQAFGASTQQRGFCAIGSAKTNLGHLETAAGVAGLIKTALALEHREQPPSLHFESPNPAIDFASSPFVVNRELRPWPAPEPGRKRVAGVSSFGIGSTNAHVILEEPPPQPATDAARPWQLLVLSARTSTALDRLAERFGRHLDAHEDLVLDDVAFTLAVGRKPFEHRRAIVAHDRAAAIAALCGQGSVAANDATTELTGRQAAFLFPGLGEHYAEMGLGLYQRESVFREALDEVAESMRPHLGSDLRDVLFPRGGDAEESVDGSRGAVDLQAMLGRGDNPSTPSDTDPASLLLDRTRFCQPALFAVEVALARLLGACGVAPQAMLGYSLGEYVCAHLAGLFSLDEICRLVVGRAALVETLPEGGMLAVALSEEEITPRLNAHGLSLAAVNGTTGCVAAGSTDGIEELAAALTNEGVVVRRLATTHAFHSRQMQPIASDLTKLVESLRAEEPRTRWISNVTGTWIRPEEAMDPSYWARHLVSPVRYADGLGVLLGEEGSALVEVGPGQSLSSFARLHPACNKERPVVATLRAQHGKTCDAAAFLGALGDLWLAGAEIDWQARFAPERRRRVPLPTYPFERQRHWIDPDPASLALSGGTPRATGSRANNASAPSKEPSAGAPVKIPDPGRWLYREAWRDAPWPEPSEEAAGTWLLLTHATELQDGLAAGLAQGLRQRGADEVVVVVPGDTFCDLEDSAFQGQAYRLPPGQADAWEKLLDALEGRRLHRIVHLLGCAPCSAERADAQAFRAAQELGFYSLIALAQALGRKGALKAGLGIDIVGHGLHEVDAGDPVAPERSTVLGPAVVIPQEHPGVMVRTLDIDLLDEEVVADRLLQELLSKATDLRVAHRGDARRVRGYESLPMPEPEDASQLREEGVYLITGGLGGIGLVLAEHLASHANARLVLTRRTPLPARQDWDAWLTEHGSGDDSAEEPGDGEADKTSRAIARVRALEAQGAEVLVAAADVADETAMRTVVDQAVARFGTIHGVIHAAGVLAPDSFKTVQLTAREECELHFGPKIYGLYVLEQVLEGLELDFVTLYSSLSAILGGLGYVGYATANLFMDHFVARHNQELAGHEGGTPWQSVDWDSWHYEEDEDARGGLGTTLSELAMAPSEGVDVLRRLLAIETPRHLVISTGELAPRLAQWVELRALRATAGGQERLPQARQTPRPGDVGDDLELRVAGVWQSVLGIDEIGRDENFFDLGGNSLLGMQMVAEIGAEIGVEVEPVALFESPTVAAMTRYLSPDVAPRETPAKGPSQGSRPSPRRLGTPESDIAIIGLDGRFPGAESVDELWENLRQGRETISFFSDDELRAAGVDKDTLADPNYVKARPILSRIEEFDAPFFGYTPREAEVMDPQHRIYLESAWKAFEDAGYDIGRFDGAVGVYAGASISSYMANLYSHPELMESIGTFQALIGNEKDSLTTKVSYKLNLRGPSLAVQTFCSTSLVAVHLACQALNTGECDMALAGGVSIIVPQVSGYRFEQGGIGSVDGHIRAFDAGGSGIVFGNGLGNVVLKRLDDALADGDPIRAVIKGTAINNDGSGKAGYSATSVEGQSKVVATALELAGIDPETIGYMEAHGTGTPLGDPIEMAALNKAFRHHTEQRKACPIGSVKTNLGHLDRAAGISGLTKTVLALEREEIPPSLHFETPNPAIDFEGSFFRVNTERSPWPRGVTPRRAGVNSLGLGGTNAHAVLEEAPEPEPSSPGRPWQILPLSAFSDEALERRTDELAEHLENHSEEPLADVAWTLQIGRKAMGRRRFAVSGDTAEAAATLRERRPQAVWSGAPLTKPRVVFLFPGLGGQHIGMARGIYASEPVFRSAFDGIAEALRDELELDLRELLFPPEDATANIGGKPAEVESADHKAPTPGGMDLRRMLGRGPATEDRLAATAVAQPALFAVEMALAKLVRSWGIEPAAMIGYSLGEYAAAAVAGMLTPEDAARLVARRAKQIQELEAGAMLAVPLPEDELRARLGGDHSALNLSVAALNGPEQSVVAGPTEAIEGFATALEAEGLASRRLETTHAFHSRMMDPLGEPLTRELDGVALRAPEIPYLSNVTGTWMRAEDATDPSYWARHMCQPVRLSDSIETLAGKRGGLPWSEGEMVLLELGPGQALGSLVLQHPAFDASLGTARATRVAAVLPHVYETCSDHTRLCEAIGKLWLHGVEIDWPALHDGERRLRRRLPTYSFDRHAYWVEGRAAGHMDLARSLASASPQEERSPIHLLSWRRSHAPRRPGPDELERLFGERHLLIYADPDDGGVAENLAARLAATGCRVSHWRPGEDPPSFDQAEHGAPPDGLLHLWSLAAPVEESSIAGRQRHEMLLEGVRQLRAAGVEELDVWTVSAGAFEVIGEETLRPSAAQILAPTRVLPNELPGTTCRAIDVIPPSNGSVDTVAERLLAEIAASSRESVAALRGNHRWVPELQSLVPEGTSVLRPAGAYLVTGGLRGRGFAFASHLARHVAGVRLVLIEEPGRSDARDRRLATLRDAGAEVLELVAQPTDESALDQALATVAERVGPLHGVIHAAEPESLEAAYVTVAEAHAKPEAGLEILESRYEGARTLDRVLARRAAAEPLDFAVLVSSMASWVGGLGLIHDAAAGLALDAFAAGRRHQGSIPWTAVSWDFWLDEDTDEARGGGLAESSERAAELQDSALDTLWRLLPTSQVLATPRSLDRWNALVTAATPSSDDTDAPPAGGLYPRPELSSTYAAPGTETEARIVEIWEVMLGVAGVGIHDGFLELGGDSLLAARMVARMRESFDLDLPVRIFFEASTVARLAAEVDRLVMENAHEDEEDLAELYQMLESLSEEEVEAELARRAE